MLFETRFWWLFVTFTTTKCANFQFKDFRISAVQPFCLHWARWRETKLLHFLIWRLFDALTILEHNLYQFMAITLRYVTILKFIYRILKPIFLWNFYCWSFNFWSIEGVICRFWTLLLVLRWILQKKAKNWKYLSKSCQKKRLEKTPTFATGGARGAMTAKN